MGPYLLKNHPKDGQPLAENSFHCHAKIPYMRKSAREAKNVSLLEMKRTPAIVITAGVLLGSRSSYGRGGLVEHESRIFYVEGSQCCVDPNCVKGGVICNLAQTAFGIFGAHF